MAAYAPASALTGDLLPISAFVGAAVAAWGSVASAETRTLKLYFIHTKEKAEITFKRNGRYDQSGLNKINRFLRDWRRNEPTRMDPRLLDYYNRARNTDVARREKNAKSFPASRTRKPRFPQNPLRPALPPAQRGGYI